MTSELHRHTSSSVITPLHVNSTGNSSSAHSHQHHHPQQHGGSNNHNNPSSAAAVSSSSHHHQQSQVGIRDINQQPQQQHHHHSRHGSNGGTPGLKPQQQRQQPQPGGGGGINNNNNNFVIVELIRDDLTCPGFGFNIKGGAEHGCPVYIWRVEPGSLADQSGLKSGDEIVQANGISFNGITHAEALKVLKGQTTLTLYIKAPGGQSQPPPPPPQQSQGSLPLPPPPIRRPPSSQQQQQQQQPIILDQPIIPLPPPLPPPPPLQHHASHQQQSHSLHHRVEYYTWVDRLGNPVPPPTPQEPFTPSRLINLEICPGQNLGLMIRGGSEYGLGIYVTGVDPGSVAERVGLQRGDEILSVNSKDFTRITHDKAVQILKSCKHMQVIATHIGKIPADLNDGEDLLKLESGNLLDEDICDVVDQEVAEIVVDPSDRHHRHIGVDDSTEILDDIEEDEIVDSLLSSASDHRNSSRNKDSKFNLDSLDLDFVRGSSGIGGSLGERGSSGGKRCTTSILQMIEEKARTVLNKSEHSRFTFYRIEYMQGFLPIVAFVRILLELLNTSEKYTLLTEVRELIRPTDLTQFDELIYTKATSFRVSSSAPPSSIPPSSIITSAVTSGVGGNVVQMNPPPQQQNPFVVDTQGIVTNQQQQQPVPVVVGPGGPPPQQIPLPPPLPPPPSQIPPHHHPPQTFLPQHQQPQDHNMMGDEIVDDFIEEHGVVLDPSGGFGSWRSGGGINNMQQQQQQQQINSGGVVQPGFGGNPTDRQLLITHDPAALTMSHPQILNVMNNPSITTSPQTTTVTSQSQILNRSPNNNLLVPGIGNQQQQQNIAGATSPNKLVTSSGLIGTLNTNTGPLVPVNANTAITGNAVGSSVPAVRFKVRITKVKPILGIAIEGGSNTPHRLPRIIDVNPDGSAFHSNLRAGQVLLTVDGKKLDGLTHEEIARLILDCYVDMTKSQIEFLVVEAKQNYYYFNSQQNMEGI